MLKAELDHVDENHHPLRIVRCAPPAAQDGVTPLSLALAPPTGLRNDKSKEIGILFRDHGVKPSRPPIFESS